MRAVRVNGQNTELKTKDNTKMGDHLGFICFVVFFFSLAEILGMNFGKCFIHFLQSSAFYEFLRITKLKEISA